MRDFTLTCNILHICNLGMSTLAGGTHAIPQDNYKQQTEEITLTHERRWLELAFVFYHSCLPI